MMIGISPIFAGSINSCILFIISEFRDWIGLTELDKKHKIGAELDEECMVILNNYFLDLADPLPVEGLDEWRHYMYNCPQEHLDEAYTFYKHYLKCMYYNSTFVYRVAGIHTVDRKNCHPCSEANWHSNQN